jgi:hypothetical protein
MSFNLLKFGINIQKPRKNVEITENKEKPVLFPNCVKEKKMILKIKQQIKNLKTSEDIEKLKEKKLTILLEKLSTAKEALYEKLNLVTQNDLDPLCSFKEIQK